MDQPAEHASRAALSRTEQRKLACYEVVISNERAARSDRGQALVGIRDARLYRATHATFDDYVSARWALEQRDVADFIAASELVDTLATWATAPVASAQTDTHTEL